MVSSLPHCTNFEVARNKMSLDNTSAIWHAAIELKKRAEYQPAQTLIPAELNVENVREKLRCLSSSHRSPYEIKLLIVILALIDRSRQVLVCHIVPLFSTTSVCSTLVFQGIYHGFPRRAREGNNIRKKGVRVGRGETEER